MSDSADPPSWAPAVRALWGRVTGGGLPVRITAMPGTRSFTVGAAGGRLDLAATDAVSACVGLHRYLIEACGSRVTWGADLPLKLGALPDTAALHGTARVDEFYYLNFCTFSYSTAYWDFAQWEREIDWMALHGVTMPLQLVGHEAALALAYSRLGMTDDEILAFLGGPGYLPWLFMGCLDSFGGPLPASWLPRHLELGRRILRRQRDFGMTPVLPAFTGHLPARLAPAGARTRYWQGLPTTVVAPGEPHFRRLTTEIVAAQHELFGTDHLYAADPFIEMVPADVDTAADYPATVATSIMDGLRAADPAARWVLQSWPFSYQSDYWTRERVRAFLDGLPRDGVLLLDLWGEADPQWPRLDGYAGRPWIFNGLLNFGGRSEPVADLAGTQRRLDAALAAEHPPVGLGLTMEAIHTTPAFFELIADRAWTGAPADLDTWIRDFGRQRYGTTDPAAGDAWSALRRSVLSADARSIFPERFIALAVTRPDYVRLLDPGATVHDDVRAALFYRPADLLAAVEALLAVPSDGGPLRDDVVLACAALLLRIIDHRGAALAVESARTGWVDPAPAAAFLAAFADLDDLVATRPHLCLDTWVAAARRWADGPAGRRVLEDNARRILTAWHHTDDPRLDDYSARVWSGLIGGYHRRRWELWLRNLPQALIPDRRAAAQAALDADLRRLAEEFIAFGPTGPEHPATDPRTAARQVLHRYGAEFRALNEEGDMHGGEY
jgi:alpha-N-acetylglucosaminidase